MGTMVVDQLWDIVEQARYLAALTEELELSITYDQRATDMDLIRTADAVQSQLDAAVHAMEEYLERDKETPP